MSKLSREITRRIETGRDSDVDRYRSMRKLWSGGDPEIRWSSGKILQVKRCSPLENPEKKTRRETRKGGSKVCMQKRKVTASGLSCRVSPLREGEGRKNRRGVENPPTEWELGRSRRGKVK